MMVSKKEYHWETIHKTKRGHEKKQNKIDSSLILAFFFGRLFSLTLIKSDNKVRNDHECI